MINDQISEKTCTRCGITRPISKFYRDATRKDGYRGVCKPCNASYATEKPGFQKNSDIDPALITGVKKICPECNEKKDLAHFTMDRHRTDGRSYYCRACKKIRYKKFAEKRKAAAKINGGAA